MLAKNRPELRSLLHPDYPVLAETLCEITSLYGDLQRRGGVFEAEALLERASRVLSDLPVLPTVLHAMRSITASRLWEEHPGVRLSIDFADMRGWQYHTGLTFSAYLEGHPLAIARGGRYDNVGVSFGRSRAATGFSLDLRELAAWIPEAPLRAAIRAPWSDDRALRSEIAALRSRGEVVVQVMPGHEDEHEEFICDRELLRRGGSWECVSRITAGGCLD